MIQSMEDVAGMEFGGMGKLIPDDQNLSKAWLAQYSAYQKSPDSYPGMSTGSASVQGSGMSLGPIGSPLPRLGTDGGAGMSMGRIGPMLPSLATGTFDYQQRSLTDDEARAAARTAGGFGGTGRPGSGGQYRSGAMLPRLSQGPEFGSGMSMQMMNPAQVDARRQQIAEQDAANIRHMEAFRARMQQAGDGMLIGGQLYQGEVFTKARSSGRSSGRAKPQQWFAPEKSEGRMARNISQQKANRIIAALSGTEDSGSVLSSKWLWIGVAVLAGVYLMNRNRS